MEIDCVWLERRNFWALIPHRKWTSVFLSISFLFKRPFSALPPEEEQNLSNMICWCVPSFHPLKPSQLRHPSLQLGLSELTTCWGFPNIKTVCHAKTSKTIQLVEHWHMFPLDDYLSNFLAITMPRVQQGTHWEHGVMVDVIFTTRWRAQIQYIWFRPVYPDGFVTVSPSLPHNITA